MAIAFDAVSHSTAAVANNFSFTHTPVGTPRGVMVFIAQNANGTDDVTGVTYGGVTMARVGVSLHSTGETGAVYIYFLGASIPTGAQTVSVTAGSSLKDGHCVSVTGATNLYVVDSDFTIASDSQANPSVTLSLLGRSSFCAIVGHSGQNAVSGITPLTNWTSRDEYDWGQQTSLVYTYDTVGTADVTAGWTQSADDATLGAIAIRETQTITLDATTAQTFSYTGTAAGVQYHRVLNATTAQTFTFSGTAAALLKNYVVQAGAGDFSYSGTDALLCYCRTLVTESGSFTYTGYDATLSKFEMGGLIPAPLFTLAPLQGDLGGIGHG